jgi:hypothetical protein
MRHASDKTMQTHVLRLHADNSMRYGLASRAWRVGVDKEDWGVMFGVWGLG